MRNKIKFFFLEFFLSLRWKNGNRNENSSSHEKSQDFSENAQLIFDREEFHFKTQKLRVIRLNDKSGSSLVLCFDCSVYYFHGVSALNENWMILQACPVTNVSTLRGSWGDFSSFPLMIWVEIISAWGYCYSIVGGLCNSQDSYLRIFFRVEETPERVHYVIEMKTKQEMAHFVPLNTTPRLRMFAKGILRSRQPLFN